MVAIVGGPVVPVIIHPSNVRGDELTSSYKEATLLLALSPYGHGVRKILLEGTRHRHLQSDKYRPTRPPAIRTHTASQGVCPLTRSDSRPYVPTVQRGAANSKTLAAEVSEFRCPPTTHLWWSFAPNRSPHVRP